jgi:hypothetical protein
MKKIYTLITTLLLFTFAEAQVVLNELYAIPGNGRHEFFELYNTAPTSAPISMDGYTVITYFEEAGNKKGFYVLDLPAQTVASKGYYVGAAASPFNYQGVANCNSANFNWNDTAFLAANGGSFKKWVLSNAVPASFDGNSNYDLENLPANFNDFFTKIGGGYASYNCFLYKDGVLMNVFLGGIGGTPSMPSYIMSMPVLFVDMAGTSTDFTINFSGYTNAPAEFVIQEAGTDNGYIRLRDGFCGSWTKSSADINHTPGTTNGGDATTVPTISISAAVAAGNAVTGSILTYNLVGAPTTSLPVTIQIYTDNGSAPGTLDPSDTYVTHSVETVIDNVDTAITFFPYNANIIIVGITNAGCIDRVYFIPNTGVLPMKLTHFEAIASPRATELKWTISTNEELNTTTIEKSFDGREFQVIGTVAGSHQAGLKTYTYTDLQTDRNAYYRIRIVDMNNKVLYSPLKHVQRSQSDLSDIQLLANPVKTTLTMKVVSNANTSATLTVYSLNGVKMFSTSHSLNKGQNNFSIPLDRIQQSGMYILELMCPEEKYAIRFMKQ